MDGPRDVVALVNVDLVRHGLADLRRVRAVVG
jgi:hypothetical protein